MQGDRLRVDHGTQELVTNSIWRCPWRVEPTEHTTVVTEVHRPSVDAGDETSVARKRGNNVKQAAPIMCGTTDMLCEAIPVEYIKQTGIKWTLRYPRTVYKCVATDNKTMGSEHQFVQ